MHCEYIKQTDFDDRSVNFSFFYSKKVKIGTLLDPSGAQKGLWHLLKVIRDIKGLIPQNFFLAHTQTLSKKVKQAKEEMDFFLFLLSSKTSW